MQQKIAGAFDPAIEYHADDYGLFLRQSKDILECYEHGCLNGVSIMVNSEDITEAIALLRKTEGIATAVHLNLVEGTCLSSPSQELGFTDGNGVFRISFGKLLMYSYLPGRRKRKAWIKEEYRRQINRAIEVYPELKNNLRLDSHVHYNMLPIVFDALMEVIQEDRLSVEYIRIPEEHISIYAKHIRKLKGITPINLVKVLVLNTLALRNKLKYRTYLNTLEKRVFLGVFLSGRMFGSNVSQILPDVIKFANKRGLKIELLAHPGGVNVKEDIAKLTSSDDISFLTSPYRYEERTMFIQE